MLEALAMGLPSVVTDCPAGGERLFINHSENGFLVKVGDVEGLYLAMKKILDDPGLSSLFSKRSPKIREQLKTENIMHMWSEAIL